MAMSMTLLHDKYHHGPLGGTATPPGGSSDTCRIVLQLIVHYFYFHASTVKGLQQKHLFHIEI